ncbi:MAG: zinc-ribbon domain-containing protein [Magnetospirillum sp.]|nr:zinc-ribbon domain-containing protein [Magnetospirillum sp.]
MLISCPSCATSFSVPDKALGAKGRTLKCAKCGDKWFQAAPGAGEGFGLDESSFPPPPRPQPQPQPQPRRPDPPPQPAPPPRAPAGGSDDGFGAGNDFGNLARLASQIGVGAPPPPKVPADFDFDLDEPPLPDFGGRGMRDSGRRGELDLGEGSPPQPIPDVFASPGERSRGGTGGLWLLLLLLLIGAAFGSAFYFQDRVVALWPPAHDILTDFGLRREAPGAGLELRQGGPPERMVSNDTDVLIMRGIIANVSDRTRAVPTMRVVLFDKDKNVVQDKLDQPPVTSLEPGGTASFRIIIPRPDPNAVEVHVVFVDPNAPAAATK